MPCTKMPALFFASPIPIMADAKQVFAVYLLQARSVSLVHGSFKFFFSDTKLFLFCLALFVGKSLCLLTLAAFNFIAKMKQDCGTSKRRILCWKRYKQSEHKKKMPTKRMPAAGIMSARPPPILWWWVRRAHAPNWCRWNFINVNLLIKSNQRRLQQPHRHWWWW